MNRSKFIAGAALCAAAGLWIGGASAGADGATPIDSARCVAADRIAMPKELSFAVKPCDRLGISECAKGGKAPNGAWPEGCQGHPTTVLTRKEKHGVWPGNEWDTGYSGVEKPADATILCTTCTKHFDDDRYSPMASGRANFLFFVRANGKPPEKLIDANIRSDWKKLSMILAAQRHAETFDDVLPLTEELAEKDETTFELADSFPIEKICAEEIDPATGAKIA